MTATSRTNSTRGSKWSIHVKYYIEKQIIDSAHYLDTEADWWLESMKKNELKDLRKINRSVLNIGFLWAAFLNNLDLMVLFESWGADIRHSDEKSALTALHLCAVNDSLKCCKWLHEKGCQILQTFDGYTPMHYAAYTNSKNVIKFLMETYSCSIPDTALHCAVHANAVECVKLLLTSSVNVNSYFRNMTSLHIAAYFGHVECMNELLKHSLIDVNLKTNHEVVQYTALHLAAERGHADCLKLLLSEQVKIDDVNVWGETALYLACSMSHVDCFKILLMKKESIKMTDIGLRTPLHAAVSAKRPSMDIVAALVDLGADIDALDNYGYSPLHRAAENEAEDCTNYLIMKGANLAIKTNEGLTALRIIKRKLPNSVSAVRDRLTYSLSYDCKGRNSQFQTLKFSFEEICKRSEIGDMNYLHILTKDGGNEVANHPLCRAFLHLKWKKVRHFYFMRTLCLTVLAILFSIYVVALSESEYRDEVNNVTDEKNNCTDPNSHCGASDNSIITIFLHFNNQTIIAYNSSTKESLIKNNTRSNDATYHLAGYTFLKYPILFLLYVNFILTLLRETVVCTSVKDYFSKLYNCLEVIVNILCSVLTWVGVLKLDKLHNLFFLTNFIGPPAVLLCWVHLTVNMAQLPFFGVYIQIFKKVCVEFLKLMSAYLSLLCGFTCTFWVLYATKESLFRYPILGFFKTIDMMAGDIDMKDEIKKLFDSRHYPYSTGTLGVLILLIFATLFTVVLMNSVIGIAVHDISTLCRNVGSSELKQRAELINFFEMACHNRFLCKFFPGLKAILEVDKFVEYKSPLNSQPKDLPKDILLDAWQCVSGKMEKVSDDAECRLVTIESKLDLLMRLLESPNTARCGAGQKKRLLPKRQRPKRVRPKWKK